ncbi:MAG: hypothetical protein AB1736_00970 [Chloroflexota bacterium]
MSRRELPMLGPSGSAKTAEPDDPLELVGVPVPVDEATFDEMARTLIEEYVRDGWTDARLLALFRSPFYAGLHVVLLRRGDAWVRAEISACRDRWSRPDPPVGGPR